MPKEALPRLRRAHPGALGDPPSQVYVRIWEFRVRSELADEFRAVYGPDGEWARLFSREAAFLGTELLHSATHPNIFVTIDRWNSEEAWAAFLRAWGDEYSALEHRCTRLTVSEGELGSFRLADSAAERR